MSEEINVNGEKKEVEKEGLPLLLDSSYPLLVTFREKCPGTYKHSQTVMSMIENLASSLSLDVNFLRVAALYHDVGKIFNPKYFTENQLDGEDPHKDLDCKISYEIITRHVSDSAMILLNDPNFSREIIEIISQHHGTTVLKYFYKKAKGRKGKKDSNNFRYKCSNPNSLESMILMICDQIEATSRSLVQTGKFDPIKVIDNTINGLISDGQLDDVVLHLGDLKRIKESLGKELEGIYQKRVDYGNIKLEEI